jgi:capsule polysaccharide export protein KpsE/RkpR
MKEELHEPQERREDHVEECKSESSQEEFVVPQRTRETLYSLIGEQK